MKLDLTDDEARFLRNLIRRFGHLEDNRASLSVSKKIRDENKLIVNCTNCGKATVTNYPTKTIRCEKCRDKP